jgi:para-nitrobenzyl esterase
MPTTPKRATSMTKRWLALLGVALLVACASTQKPMTNDGPLGPPVDVTTTEGMVRGVTERGVHIFLGVPYAAPVWGLERWLPPKPPEKRDGVFDASNYGPACEQTIATIPKWMLTKAGEVALYEMSDLEGFAVETKSGDCLRMNIWTPQLPDPAAQATTAEPSPAEPPAAPVKVEEGVPTDGGATAVPMDGGTMDGGIGATTSEGAETDTQSSESTDAPPTDNRGSTDGGVPTQEPDGGVLSAAPETSEMDPEPAETQAVQPSKGLPVIVKLHGGGLTSGSGRHPALKGMRMAQKGAVVITMNYRLGSIGYLAGDGLFEGDAMQGNRGFMDTVRALEWIRDNIARFGGDPENVTLMGQSGGGTNVWSTLASPASEGLVRRAIIMSGPIYDYPIEEHKKLTTAVLEGWDVPVGDTNALANIEADDAISTASTTTLVGSDEFGSMSRTYLPNAGATGTTFLPDDILTAMEKGRFDNIDLLIGHCDDDAKVSIIMVPLPNSIAINIWNGYIGGLISDTDEGYDEMTQKYIEAMPEVSETRAKEQLQTDALYRVRALKAAAIHSERTKEASQGRTYAYQFNWKSPTYPEDLGAMHGLDVMMAFGNLEHFPTALGIKEGKVDPSTQALSDAMAEAVVNFAWTGQPTSSGLPEWPEYDPEKRNTMVFNNESKVVPDPGGKLRKLWE